MAYGGEAVRGRGRSRLHEVIVVILMVVLSGCGGRAAPPDGEPAVPDEVAVTDIEASAAPSNDAEEAPASGVATAEPPDSAGAGTPAGSAGVDPEPSPTISVSPVPVRIAVAHGCVAPGEPQVITIHAARRAGMTAIIAFADGASHGQRMHGVSDDQGQFVWRLVVPPDVPPGPARVGATSTGPDWLETGGGDAGGTGMTEFQVREPGGCRM